MKSSAFDIAMKQMVAYERFFKENKAGYTATPVACGWAGAVIQEVTSVKLGLVMESLPYD